VDDIIVISKEPMNVINQLKQTYILKGIGTPEYYLGGNFNNLKDLALNEKGITTAVSASTYIHKKLD
jgi:hypothetical protein